MATPKTVPTAMLLLRVVEEWLVLGAEELVEICEVNVEVGSVAVVEGGRRGRVGEVELKLLRVVPTRVVYVLGVVLVVEDEFESTAVEVRLELGVVKKVDADDGIKVIDGVEVADRVDSFDSDDVRFPVDSELEVPVEGGEALDSSDLLIEVVVVLAPAEVVSSLDGVLKEVVDEDEMVEFIRFFEGFSLRE